MKKLSFLIALMLFVTIGGVYATWSYAGTDDIADALAEAKVVLADVELFGANGVYKIESNLVLTVDQANTDHEAELVFSSNDTKAIHLTVTFTPSTNASQDIKDNAVPSELYFGVTTPMQYKIDGDGNYSATGTATDIFKFTNPSNGIFNKNIDWTPQADGSFIYTMDVDALQAQISLNHNFVLDTKNEYDEFRKVLVGNVTARVSDGIATDGTIYPVAPDGTT